MTGDEGSKDGPAQTAGAKEGKNWPVITGALIGAAATVAAALIGLYAAKSGGATTPATSTPPAHGTGHTPADTAVPASPSTGAGVRYQGDRMLTGSGLDLDHVPPDPSWEDLRYDDGTGVSVAPALAAAPWTGQGAPSPDRCEKALREEAWPSGHSLSAPAPGTAFCMRTNKERLAHVRIVRAADDGFLVHVLVWQ